MDKRIALWFAAAALAAAPAFAGVRCRDGANVPGAEGCALHGGEETIAPDRSPARNAFTPTQRAEDRPAHESPYSAFGAPHAKAPGTQIHRRTGRRVHCKDGTIETRYQHTQVLCAHHGGIR